MLGCKKIDHSEAEAISLGLNASSLSKIGDEVVVVVVEAGDLTLASGDEASGVVGVLTEAAAVDFFYFFEGTFYCTAF